MSDKEVGGALGMARDLHESEQQRQFEHDRGIVEIAVLRMKGELAADKEAAEAAAGGGENKPGRDRGLGAVQKQALVAAIAVFIDSYGKSDFPTKPHEMARAVVAKATELGMTASDTALDPRSGSVKSVAQTALHAARWLDNRDLQNTQQRNKG
jgi:hypothetical protein